ncbi:DUF2510 domain-containing protein [Nocardioides sp. YIM 152588]|uniref:DUF2510 domain-containing protein n=1 Tax=Nocardioides sp. YIM 152588 TaxID=3158259 RepID=UPI0032E45344
MDFKGYNGTISIDGDRMTLTHSGLVAKAGGLVRDQPRSIPLQAVSDVAFKDASRMANGWITLGLGGANALSLTSSTAASNPDTVMFRHKDAERFRDLHRWLVGVAQKNLELGIDFAGVAFDAAGVTRSERIQAKLDSRTANPDENSAAMNPAAGWYPDTTGDGRLRYWDGAAWTDQFAPMPDRQTPTAASMPPVRGKVARDERPFGRAVPPWTEKLVYQDIVGESFHEDAFKAIAAEYGQRTLPDWGYEIPEAVAAIVPDPDNAFDPNAVAIWVEGRHLVGYLPRNVASLYAPKLEALERGTYLHVPARVWIGRDDWDQDTGARKKGGVRGSVSVRLPEPDGIYPFNDLPDEPHTVLPWGRAVQIAGEEEHMDVLRTFALGSDPRHVAATLHVVDEARKNGDPVRLVEVRLDGERVGLMSKVTSEQIRDLVSFVADKGRVPVARAIVKGSDLRADVTVHVARTSDVPHKWLEAVDTP